MYDILIKNTIYIIIFDTYKYIQCLLLLQIKYNYIKERTNV